MPLVFLHLRKIAAACMSEYNEHSFHGGLQTDLSTCDVLEAGQVFKSLDGAKVRRSSAVCIHGFLHFHSVDLRREHSRRMLVSGVQAL